MSELNVFEESLLAKPTLALHSFSDVFSSGETPPDFDAELTTLYRHLLLNQSNNYGLKKGSHLEKYAAELINFLIAGVKKEIRKAEEDGREDADLRRADHHLGTGSTRVILNSAPRSKATQNGGDYFLAITDQGVELYVSTLEHLTYVRDRVESLFRIPNKDNPVFDGEKEQFRSSVIARSAKFPDHLQRVKDPQAEIPAQENPLEVAYTDKFGNVRLRAKDIGETRAEIEGNKREYKGKDYVYVSPCSVPYDRSISVAEVGESLDQITDGRLGLYENVADGAQPSDGPGYLELAKKWSEPKGFLEWIKHFASVKTADGALGSRPGKPVYLHNKVIYTPKGGLG